MSDKLFAEWFWTDRWVGSSAFLLPVEARGVYREMLTQAWRRGAQLPNDHEAIRRATGVTLKEWARTWPLIERYWRVDGDTLVNDTQMGIYAEAMGLTEKRSRAGRAGNEKRWGHRKRIAKDIAKPVASDIANGIATDVANSVANTIAKASPLNSVRTYRSTPPTPPSEQTSEQPPNGVRANGRSKRPIYTGNRLVVFEWQLDDLMKILGPHVDDFELDQWFQTLDQRTMRSNMVIPKRDGGAWLQQETIAEARRRGLRIAGDKTQTTDDPYADFTKAWTCRTCGQIHEGTVEQAKRRECLAPGRAAS